MKTRDPRRVAARVMDIFTVLVPILVVAVCFLAVHSFQQDAKIRRQQAAIARQQAALATQAHENTQQNVEARFDHCSDSDRLRTALYGDALQGRTTAPLLLRLVPSLNTPEVRLIVRTTTGKHLKAYAPRGKDGCATFALRSVPPRTRSSYHVP